VAAAAPRLSTFDELVAYTRARRDVALLRALEHDMRIVAYEFGRIEFTPTPTADPALAPTLAKKLQDWTGARWMIAIAQGAAAPTLREVAEARDTQKKQGAAQHPVVAKVLELFPGAKIVAIKEPEIAPPEAPPPADEDVGYTDAGDFDDDL
jgi:DNA polymerase-3 subunit gamma/tau